MRISQHYFLKIVARGTWNAFGRLETGDGGLLKCSRWSIYIVVVGVKWRSRRKFNCAFQNQPVLRKYGPYATKLLTQTKTATNTKPPTKGLMSRTMVVHVCYRSLYISLLSSAQKQCEMITFPVFWRTQKTGANFWYFHLELKRWYYIFSLNNFSDRQAY